MALRHAIPVAVGDMRPKVELKVPPAMRPPITLEFRRGADMKEFAAEVGMHTSVMVDAAVGAGKSTLLPKELAMNMKKLVFFVCASRLLVRDQYKYATRMANDGVHAYPDLCLFDNYEQQLPRIGVCYISAAAFVGLILKHGLESYDQCLVFLDEAHESDAYTHFVRNLSLSAGAGHLVQASATFSAGGFRKRESVGRVVEKTYSAERAPALWDLCEKGAPWCYSSLQDNLLIYTDSRTEAKTLCDGYSDLGLKTFHMTADMSDAEFDLAMATMRNKKEVLVVLVADYSFRSGFTFEVGRIVDTARVAYFDPTPGVLAKRNRSAFAFEIEQAAGRGGRTKGLTTEYFRPKREYDNMICDLEGVEAEAAAYLYRLAGYKPVRELATAVMASYDLPESARLISSLNGIYPLAYQVVGEGGVLRPGAVKASIDTGVSSGTEADLPPRYSEETERSADSMVEDDGSDEEVPRPVTPEVTGDAYEFCNKVKDSEQWPRLLNALGKHRTLPLEVGNLCEIAFASDVPGLSLSFVSGLDSALRFLSGDKARMKVRGLSSADKATLMTLLVERYNLCAVEVMAMGQALMSMAEDIVNSASSVLVKDFFVGELEKAVSFDAEQVSLYQMMTMVETESRMRLRDMGDTTDLVSKRVDDLQSSYVEVMAKYASHGGFMRTALKSAIDGGALSGLSGGPGVAGKGRLRFLENDFSQYDKYQRRSREDATSDVRRDQVTRRSGYDGDGTTVEVRLPSWTGFKACRYEVTGRDVTRVQFRSSRKGFLKQVTGKHKFEV